MELKSARPSVRIVLPAYNEQESIANSAARICEFCSSHLSRYRWHILIAENGSTDSTPELADDIAKSNPDTDVLHLAVAGRGGALRAASANCKSDYLLYSDVDLSADLEALPKMIEALDSGADLAIGSRLHSDAKVQRRVHREVLSRGYNLILQKVLGVRKFKDAQCGLKAWRIARIQSLIDRVEDNRWFFDTELLVLAEYSGFSICEIPVSWIEDPDTSVQILNTIAAKVRGVLRLRKKMKQNKLQIF